MHRRSFLAALAVVPAGALKAQTAEHPRLFLNAARAGQLRRAIQTTHAGVWKAVREQADQFAAQRPPAYHAAPDANDEQLWQREVGNKLPFLGMAQLLTGETIYLEAATKWSLAVCDYATWGQGIRDGVDLAAGHQLFGLALVYDWLHASLAPEAGARIQSTLIARGERMFRAARESAYWRNSYLQNHLWVNAAGLVAAGLALEGEHPTGAWLELARAKFRRTEAELGPDGASHEGVGYWSYGVEYLLKYWQLAADAFGENLSSPWWKQTAGYRQYLGLPRNSWESNSTIVDIADCVRADYYGPDYLLRRLAAMNRDPHAQWLAGELDRAGVSKYAARWLNLIWYDPSIQPQAPVDLPTLRHFADLGIVSARSGWDGNESLLVFKCGPPLGHAATDRLDVDAGSGHVHPDANHFVIFGNGEWLLRDDGYAWKQTDHHNTLLIDGRGQMGEGAQWFRGIEPLKAKAHPRVRKAEGTADVDEMAGDATAIYPPGCGLKSFVRRLFFLKPDVAIVVDEIETDQPRRLELRFHPEYPCEGQEDGSLLARGKKAALRIELLTPEGVAVQHGPIDGKDRDGKPMPMHTVRFETRQTKWRNAVALSWCAAAGTPTRVTLDKQSDRWVFHAGARAVLFNTPAR
jgi:hypothetical protein